ncbi:DUF2513 domain-containing protein [Sinorhizobium medicae]|nr:DUF2513 domain-containing protein [Sinorhizobium medicae]
MSKRAMCTLKAESVNTRAFMKWCEGRDLKLEMDLLRELLLYVEKNADRPHSDLENIEIDGWSKEQIEYHVVLAFEDGLIKARIDELPDFEDAGILHIDYSVHRLTMRGHNFLGSIVEPSNWEAIKGGAKKAGAVTTSLLYSIAEAYVKQRVTEITGIPL